MAADMASVLGVELEMVESSWANSILDVQSGRVDVAFALTALPGRGHMLMMEAEDACECAILASIEQVDDA